MPHARLNALRSGIYLRGLRRLEADGAGGAFESSRSGALVERHQQPFLFLQEARPLAAQFLVFIAVADGRKMLARGDNKAGSKHQPARQQPELPRKRASVALASDGEIQMVLRHSSHYKC